MADLADHIAAAVGIPMIYGVAAAVKLLEALYGMRLRTSERGDYGLPVAKPFTGQMACFA